MGMIHDVYLFDQEIFMTAIRSHMEAIEGDDWAYSLLRATAIDLYDASPQVRRMAVEYGGWDRTAITTQVPSDHPQAGDDIAFWFVILLYGYCRVPGEYVLGLGAQWRLVDDILAVLGWDASDRDLLIKGNKFSYLVQETLLRVSKNVGSLGIMDYWEFVHPFSQGGRAGWLGYQDIQRLLKKARDDEYRLVEIQKTMKANLCQLQRSYQAVLEMLTAAEKAHCSLCVIISG